MTGGQTRFMIHFRQSKLFRWLIILIAVLTAFFSFSGCSGEEAADIALSVLETVLSDSEESVPSEQFAPSETANAPPEFSSEQPGSSQVQTSSSSAADISSTSSEPTSSNSPEIPEPAVEDEPGAPAIDEDGWYSTKDEVALYLHTFGKLPGNFLTKKEASELGWDSRKGNLWDVAEGKSIGGDTFGNREGLLPSAKGRKWYECDINYQGGFRGAERILFSSDGLIYYTDDHYQSYTQLY